MKRHPAPWTGERIHGKDSEMGIEWIAESLHLFHVRTSRLQACLAMNR